MELSRQFGTQLLIILFCRKQENKTEHLPHSLTALSNSQHLIISHMQQTHRTSVKALKSCTGQSPGFINAASWGGGGVHNINPKHYCMQKLSTMEFIFQVTTARQQSNKPNNCHTVLNCEWTSKSFTFAKSTSEGIHGEAGIWSVYRNCTTLPGNPEKQCHPKEQKVQHSLTPNTDPYQQG